MSALVLERWCEAWESQEFVATRSPSPRPSPSGRGRMVRLSLAKPRLLDFSKTGVRDSLSPMERAGVRGDETHEAQKTPIRSNVSDE